MLENYSKRLKYIRDLFAHQNPYLEKIDLTIRKNDLPIHIEPEEGKLLQLLIKLSNAKKIVEIGTLAGYSTIWMAEALITEDSKIYTIEHDPERQKLAEESFANYSNNHRISLLKGNAKKILPSLNEQAPFDMIFIDADKPGYNSYLDWAEENIKYGGLIIADDTFLSEAVYLEELPSKIKQSTRDLMNEFNRRLADSSKYQSIMIPNERGLTIAIKCF
ncbi:MAG: O-methyltransferase [Alphaproteobacteria bacterium]